MQEKELQAYLDARISKYSYRGVHVAQQNRLPESKLVAILTCIFRVVGTSSFLVPAGDDPEPQRIHSNRALTKFGNDHDYKRILDEIARWPDRKVTATFNSLKKNHFPNFEGMGLLQRNRVFRANGYVIEARLTDAALEIINEGPTRNRTVLVGKASERLIPRELINQIHWLLTKLDALNIYEIMLFASDNEIDQQEKEKLIREYRRLKALNRIGLHVRLQERCAKTMRLPDKKEKRDWNNWRNQAQQIVNMLSTVAGFNVYNEQQVTLAGPKVPPFFDATRSATVKRNALNWHGIAPLDGWELHHIYPVEYATCDRDMSLIDSKENLLYIPAAKHRQIPNRGNLSVQLDYSAQKIWLSNPMDSAGKPRFDFAINSDVYVSDGNLSVMRAYNRKLLELVG